MHIKIFEFNPKIKIIETLKSTQMKVHNYSMPCGLHECLDQSELCFLFLLRLRQFI